MTTSLAAILRDESSFESFARNFVKQMTDHTSVYKLTAEELKVLQDGLQDWEDSSLAATEARDAAKAATEVKEGARSSLTDGLRVRIRMIQADPSISDEAKIEAGIRPHSPNRKTRPAATHESAVQRDCVGSAGTHGLLHRLRHAHQKGSPLWHGRL